MSVKNKRIINSDFLVVGSGIAGLSYALEVSKYGTVSILCKSGPAEGSTKYAQGGIASVTSPLDSFEDHINDTKVCGAGLCNEEVVEFVIEEGPECIKKLIEKGTKFDEHKGEYSLGKEGGHSKRRILHAGDSTGAEIQRALIESAKADQNITLYPYHVGIDLILKDSTSEDAQALGIYALDIKNSSVVSFIARTTIIAAGGAGTVYLYTSNPVVATGDGIAMAYRAGAVVSNMEFFQFHPTCLFHPEARSFLLTEALRGEGALLRRADGHRFMKDYHEQLELAPRDVVSRAIDDQMKTTGQDFMYLDITDFKPEFVKSRFPTIYERLTSLGINPLKDRIPIVPAAHYCCGGIKTNNYGKTNIKRLYASGEATCTGLHGANRLASNSLLEALVFSTRAAKDTIENLENYKTPEKELLWDDLNTPNSSEEVVVSHAWQQVRRTMWNLVGIVRSDSRLELAKKRIDLIEKEIKDYYWKYAITRDLIELRNIITIADLIIRSAMQRKESRGLHYNIDHPEKDDKNFKVDTELKIDNKASI